MSGETLKDKVSRLADQIHSEVINNRRYLHTNPELSFHEYNTSAFVKSQLDALGISYQSMANTGIVALISGNIPSDKVVALRADMDGLPILEANNVPYKSINEGVTHACGHDVHTHRC